MGKMKSCIKRSNTIVLVPYPAQGHVTPMLKLASAFLNHGFNPVLVTPDYIHSQIVPKIESKDKIRCVPIPDGLDKDAPRDFFAIEKAMENNMPAHLEKLVHQLNEDDEVVCVVVDLLASWAIEVANRCGIRAAGFWPAMFATYRLIGAIPEMVRTGLISDAGFPKQLGGACFLPSQPMLSSEELPWLIGTPTARKARFKFWTRALDRSKSLQWLLLNSFPNEYCLDDKQSQQQQLDLHPLVKTTQSQPLVLPIGPLSKLTTTKNPSFWEEDTSCLSWLDKQSPNTVIYISFGSWVSPIGEAKVKSLALALEALGKPFIWVLRTSWREGLPIGYLEKVSKIGKIVSWAPQMEVLKHRAVGCYLTHCGWNSIMEAIQCQKRLMCYPVAGDQFVNCGYIVNMWRIGVRLAGFEEKDVEEGLKRLMEEDEIGNRLGKLYERTMGYEANSRAVSNLTAFIDQLKMLTLGYSSDGVYDYHL